MIYEGEFRGQGSDGRPYPRAGPLKIALIVPQRMINGPFRDLKLWFVDQYNKRYHHGGEETVQSDENEWLAQRKAWQRQGPPKFYAKDVRFVRKDGSGVYDVDTISRSVKDNMNIWLVMGGEREAGKDDKFKQSPLVGAASQSLYAVRRQRALDKANEMDKLYEAHAKMIAEQEDVQGIILKRAAIARAHKAYAPRLTELTTLGLIGEVRAFLRDEACDPQEAIHEAKNVDGDTPLALACMFGHRNVVLELLKYNINPNQPCKQDDWTPIVHAARCCHHEIVRDLLQYGADRSRLNTKHSVWNGDHVLQHSYAGIGIVQNRTEDKTKQDRQKTTNIIQTYDMPSSWIEVIDDHWANVAEERQKLGVHSDPSHEFKRLAKIESYKNTNGGRPPKYLPYKKASLLVRTKTITKDQLDRLQAIWKLIATSRAVDDQPDDGVVEGERDPVMNKTRLLAALVDRKRNAKIKKLLTGGHDGGRDSDVNDDGMNTLPSLMVLLKPNLWKEAFLEMDSRLGAGRIAFDEFVAFVLVSDSPSGIGRATLRQIFDTLDPYRNGHIYRKDLLKALCGVSLNDHRTTQTKKQNDWAIKMITKIPSLQPLLKPSSWTILFPTSEKNQQLQAEQEMQKMKEKHINMSIREEKLEKIKSEFQDEENSDQIHAASDQWGKERKQPSSLNTLADRKDILNFSDFFDRAHQICSEIGKFLPYKDLSKLREERISLPGDSIYARWKGSREYYPSTIIFGKPPLYSVSYESGEYDAEVHASDIIYPEDFLKLQDENRKVPRVPVHVERK